MPFSHIHYRCLKASSYNAKQRRCCFLVACLIYAVAITIVGLVFVWLYIKDSNYVATLSCSSCASLGATTNCAYQTCCNQTTGEEYWWADCAGVSGGGGYLTLAIIFFTYDIYEILMAFLMFCFGSGLDQDFIGDLVVVDPNQQLVDMSAYPQIYEQDGPPFQTPQKEFVYNNDLQ